MAKSKEKVEGSKAKQDIFPKAPPGYRLATTEERMEILQVGIMLQNAQQTIGRCDAEIRAARLEIAQAQRTFALGQTRTKELNKKLGIGDDKEGLLTLPDGTVAILVDKAKRDAALKLLEGGKKDEPEKAVKVSDGLPPGVEDKDAK